MGVDQWGVNDKRLTRRLIYVTGVHIYTSETRVHTYAYEGIVRGGERTRSDGHV